MAERGPYRSDAELGEALRALGRELDYPETPDLVDAVREQITKGQVSPRRLPGAPRRLVAIAAILVVLILAALVLSPGARSTFAGWFDLPGVTFFAGAPDERPAAGGALRLGEPATLDEAASRVEFPVLVPDLSWLGDPDEVYVDAQPAGGPVSFVYHASDRLPQTEETGVGLLLSQFQGRINPEMYAKGLPPGVRVEMLEINGETAYWISGEPHTFSYYSPDGEYVEGSLRLAGNTLLWQDGELTFRLESALDLDTALAIAGSMTAELD